MPLLSLLPGAFKDLLRYVPTLLLEVVDWKSMTKDLSALSGRLMTGNGAAEVRQDLVTIIPKSLRFSDNLPKLDLNDQRRQQLGELLLELYFTEILSGKPFFLDLRLRHFSNVEDQFLWSPGNLWGEFSPAFVRGMGELYAGFYDGSDEVFVRGLIQTGLIQTTWPQADQDRMLQLLKKSFAEAANKPMKFELKIFQQNFQEVFKLLLEKKSNLSSDFLLLGITIVTLYTSLEELDGTYDVGPLYRKALTHI